MKKEKLKQYRALQKEIPKVKNDICKLEAKLAAVPVVKTKVTKSMDEFPYTESHVTVEAEEPRQATELKKQIRLKEIQLEKAERDETEILEFINGIEDSTDRQIFELVFMEGKTHKYVGEYVGYSRSRISQIIGDYLKD